MAMTGAQRQQAYRRRHLAEGNAERLNVVVSAQAKRQLERLAKHRDATQREVLESVLAQAERRTDLRLNCTADYDNERRFGTEPPVQKQGGV